MGFTSELYRGEVIINDDVQTERHADMEGCGRGLDLGLRGPGDFEYGEFAAPFPDHLLIPESEWEARIKEMEEQRSRVSDLIRMAKLPPKNQESTNYCWINAPVHCVEIMRLQQNQKTVILSPASVGAQIKNYRNVGGWGLEGLQWIVKNGVTPVSLWPANAIDRRYATADARQTALDYRIDEWIECKPRTVNQMMSMLLRRYAGAVGYGWWEHEVNCVDPVWIDGGPAIRIRNQWAGWGDYGFGILQGRKMLADDIVFPVAVLAS